MLKKVICQCKKARFINGKYNPNANCGRIIGSIDTSHKKFDGHYCKDCKAYWVITKKDGKFFMHVEEEMDLYKLDDLEVTVTGYKMRIS